LADETLTLQAEALRKLDPATLKDGKAVPAKIAALAEAVVSLNLIEAMQLSEVLKAKLGVSDMAMPMMHSGGGMAAPAAAAPAAAPVAAAAAASPAAAAAAAPAKEEKAHVDIKLKAFKPENKIKVIKEVRVVTNLGLKEAKDLVESAPCTLMTKVKKEEALKIIEKLKAETGAELELA
jgi:large subunit ribosomal protein L7/L12